MTRISLSVALSDFSVPSVRRFTPSGAKGSGRAERPGIEEPACFGDELGGGEAGGADAACDERIGGGAVQADGVAKRTRAVQALAEERAHDASEHVAGAAAREARV